MTWRHNFVDITKLCCHNFGDTIQAEGLDTSPAAVVSFSVVSLLGPSEAERRADSPCLLVFNLDYSRNSGVLAGEALEALLGKELLWQSFNLWGMEIEGA